MTPPHPPLPPPDDAPPAGLREENKRDKLARIRRAAVELFRERGFDATTTREIAQRAGIAVGTLFLYVKTKEELVFLLFREEIERVQAERFASMPASSTTLDRLCYAFEGFLEMYARDVELSRVLLREVLFLRGELSGPNTGLAMDFVARLAQILADAQARGELSDDVPPHTVAMHCFAMYLLAVLAVLQGAPVPGALASLREGVALHLRGITPRGSERHAPGAGTPPADPTTPSTKKKLKKPRAAGSKPARHT